MLTWVCTWLEIEPLILSFSFWVPRLVVMSEVEEGYSVVAGPLSINDFLRCSSFYIGACLLHIFNGQWFIHLSSIVKGISFLLPTDNPQWSVINSQTKEIRNGRAEKKSCLSFVVLFKWSFPESPVAKGSKLFRLDLRKKN